MTCDVGAMDIPMFKGSNKEGGTRMGVDIYVLEYVSGRWKLVEGY